MKKILALLAILILFIGGYSMFGVNQGPSKEEMIEVLKSKEVVDAIERAIHNREEKALTPEGVIKEYDVIYDSVKWNPMGGIDVDIILNKDKTLILNYTINKMHNNYKVGSSSVSKEVYELLESVYGE